MPFAVVEAYFAGLQVGGDPEALEDLGIPVSPEGAKGQFESGQAVLQQQCPIGADLVRAALARARS